MAPPDFVDLPIGNADWIKQTSPGSWDVDLPTAEDFEAMPIDQVEFYMSLPVWSQAPDEIREIAEQRLAEVAD